MTCENLCDTSTSPASRAVIDVPPNHLNRRAVLTGIGAALAGFGLAGPAESALAAAKTYTVGKTTDIAVGSARMYQVAGVPVLVTQPKKGIFKAFNGFCTHQQVQISGLQGTNLVCEQHGSSFNSTTGKVTNGPARTGLANYKTSVSGTTLKVSL
jgi:nitrite reductase/ring-hydroxylating ferredoxin subunit